jgi:hypothetical protein
MSKITVHGVTIEIEGDPIIRVKPDGTVTVGQRQKETVVAIKAATEVSEAALIKQVTAAFDRQSFPPLSQAGDRPASASQEATWFDANRVRRMSMILSVLHGCRQPVSSNEVARRLGLTEKPDLDAVRHRLTRMVQQGIGQVRQVGAGPRNHRFTVDASAPAAKPTPAPAHHVTTGPTYDENGTPTAVFQHAAAAKLHASMLKLVWDALLLGPWVNFRDICGRIGFDPNDVADFSNGREVSLILKTLVTRGYVVSREHGGHAGRLVYATTKQAGVS